MGRRFGGGWREGRLCVRCRSTNRDREQKEGEEAARKAKAKPNQEEDEEWDPVLVAGDCLMMIATELASERIPLHDQGFMCFLVCTAWTLVASARGDYKHSNLDLEPFADYFMIAPMLASMQSALYTWVLFAPAVVGLLSYLASHGVVDPSIVAQGEDFDPAIIEVMWGSVLTMTSWRGIYVGLNGII